MNAEGTKITGLAQNKVIYHVQSPWGAMTGFEYAKAKACFDDWCKSL